MSKASYHLCWVDDQPGFPASLAGHFKILREKYDIEFDIDEHINTDNFDTIARNIGNELICVIDYNLKTNDGKGLDGHDVIAMIRKYNDVCKIVFYSSKATQEELRNSVSELNDVTCVLRENLKDYFTSIADGSIN